MNNCGKKHGLAAQLRRLVAFVLSGSLLLFGFPVEPVLAQGPPVRVEWDSDLSGFLKSGTAVRIKAKAFDKAGNLVSCQMQYKVVNPLNRIVVAGRCADIGGGACQLIIGPDQGAARVEAWCKDYPKVKAPKPRLVHGTGSATFGNDPTRFGFEPLTPPAPPTPAAQPSAPQPSAARSSSAPTKAAKGSGMGNTLLWSGAAAAAALGAAAFMVGIPTSDDNCPTSPICPASTVLQSCGCPPGSSQTGGPVSCGPGEPVECIQCIC